VSRSRARAVSTSQSGRNHRPDVGASTWRWQAGLRSPHVTTSSLTIEQVLTLLAETPPRIAALTAGLAPAQLHTTPNPDGWSPNEVLAHLRACADVWGNCMVAMVAEDAPTLRAVNPRTWIKQTDYRELEFRPSVQAYLMQRHELLAVLEPLPRASRSRTATVTGAGAVLVRTVLLYGQSLARHERQHVKQFESIVDGSRCSEASRYVLSSSVK
jgi:hypothetical protein